MSDANDMSTIDAYIALQPEECRPFLKEISDVIRRAAPEATETIGWGMPTFVLAGANLVHFACFRHHAGFYPGSGAVAGFREKFSGYVTGKGSVQLPCDRPVPAALIADVVRYRVRENIALAEAKKGKKK